MPTGYTSKLYEGTEQSFPEFVIACAHAFCVALRDEPIGAPLPKFVPDTKYYDELVTKGRARLAEVRRWTDEQANDAAEEAYAVAVDAWRASQAKAEALRLRYEWMLAHVDEWDAPTDNHQGLKEFMHKQLAESIQFDCGSYDAPKRATGSEFRSEQIRKAEWDISYGTQHRAEELQRAEANNAWADALVASLSVPFVDPQEAKPK